MFTMKELPFELSALEPYMSARTLNFHYNKHYKTYLDNLNKLIKDTDYANKTLEAIVKDSYRAPEHRSIYNNAGQVWNHQFFWNSLSSHGANEPSIKLQKQIEESFGSYDNFKSEFKTKALGLFGSGWCWLVQKDGKLEIVTTSNADNPISLDLGLPVICIDVWEHAYYLDYQNRRSDFIDIFLNHLIKW